MFEPPTHDPVLLLFFPRSLSCRCCSLQDPTVSKETFICCGGTFGANPWNPYTKEQYNDPNLQLGNGNRCDAGWSEGDGGPGGDNPTTAHQIKLRPFPTYTKAEVITPFTLAGGLAIAGGALTIIDLLFGLITRQIVMSKQAATETRLAAAKASELELYESQKDEAITVSSSADTKPIVFRSLSTDENDPSEI